MSGYPPFNVQVQGDLQEALNKVSQAAANEGVQFRGNTQNGSFSGMGVTGSYLVSGGNIVTVSISSIGFPAAMMYDYNSLSRKIREFFS